MRKVVVGTFVTLDGVMQAPGGPTEDSFRRVRARRLARAVRRRGLRPADGGADAAGRRGCWGGAPTRSSPPLAADRRRGSDRGEAQPGAEVRRLAHARVGRVGTPDGAAGRRGRGRGSAAPGRGAARSRSRQRRPRPDAAAARLVDELPLWTFRSCSARQALFADGTVPRTFRLVESSTTSTGATYAVLERDGEPTYGSFPGWTTERERQSNETKPASVQSEHDEYRLGPSSTSTRRSWRRSRPVPAPTISPPATMPSS